MKKKGAETRTKLRQRWAENNAEQGYGTNNCYALENKSYCIYLLVLDWDGLVLSLVWTSWWTRYRTQRETGSHELM